MDLYKYVCRGFVIPLWAIHERTPYLNHLKYLEKSQYLDYERVKELQWEKLKKLLSHAYENTTLYKEKFNKQGVHPNDITTWNEYINVSFLTKEDVRNHGGKLYAPNFDKYIQFKTSGSTGIPIEGYRNKSCHEFKRACGVRSNLWSGYQLGERIYCLYGNPKKKLTWRINLRRRLLTRESYLNSLDLREDSMMQFALDLRKRPPSLLWGHAHNLYLFACFLEKKGINDIRPKGMYSAGMVLHEWEREKVENVFQCELQDRYGCEELGLIATECKKKEGLHINTDDVYLEFLGKDNHPVPYGAPGRIVITDLSNYVMPFIRYEIGDIGTPSSRKCSCGRTQPLIERIEGRVADFLITPEGKMISGISLTDHFGANIPGVAQIQIIQEAINFIKLKIVKGDNFSSESLKTIKVLFEEYFGELMKCECDFVERIPPDKSGKYRFTICKIDNPFMANR